MSLPNPIIVPMTVSIDSLVVPMTVSADAETVQLSVALDPKGDVVLVINDGTQFDVSVVGQTLVFTRSE